MTFPWPRSLDEINEYRDVALAASFKFIAEAAQVQAYLEGHGVTCYAPDYEFNEVWESITPGLQADLVRLFLRKIDHSAILYIVTRDGYMGLSTAIEAGYAHGKGKKVVTSERVSDPAVQVIVDSVLTPDDLIRYLKGALKT
ncbi:MAG: hypothetical protein HYU30_07220 [Chloroflexi bacterium]|nr:hypothetical protein [Chloroflexota bacterium]